MATLKDRIPTEEVLKDILSARTPDITAAIRTQVGDLESDYITFFARIRRGGMIVIGVIVGLVLYNMFIPPLVAVFFGPQFAPITFFIPIVFFVYFILFKLPGRIRSLYAFFKAGALTAQRFNHGVNTVVFREVLSVLDLSQIAVLSRNDGKGFAMVVPGSNNLLVKDPLITALTDTSEVSTTALAWLQESELITEPRNNNKVGDVVQAQYNNRQCSFAELHIQHETGSGKNRSVKDIFKGYLAVCEHGRMLSGKTFISTEGDESGWGHRSFWNTLTDKGVQETVLEWNAFEQLLHVATTDPTEARYVLSTDFMQDLYDWWYTQNSNIRISFIGTRMYVLFPDSAMSLRGSIARIDEKMVADYSVVVARPLLHIMHLIEDVRL